MMKRYEVKFETPLDAERGEFSKRFQKNIMTNFETRLKVGDDPRVVAIEYEVEGTKLSGYRLVATVTYKSTSEQHPAMIFKSARWKAVYDKEGWSRRTRLKAKKMVQEEYGQKTAEEWFPDLAEEEE